MKSPFANMKACRPPATTTKVDLKQLSIISKNDSRPRTFNFSTHADSWIALFRYESELHCQQASLCYLKAVFSFT